MPSNNLNNPLKECTVTDFSTISRMKSSIANIKLKVRMKEMKKATIKKMKNRILMKMKKTKNKVHNKM